MRIISPICGFISLALGIIVLFGWYTHSLTLIQVHESFVAMQYNTALGFLVCGIGLIAINLSKSRATQISGIFLLLLGGLTLVQDIFGPDLGIDQLLMEFYVSAKSSHPGRMAPNAALCFFLVGLFLYISSQLHKLKANAKVLGFLGGLIFVLGVVAFSGYLSGVEMAYGWGNLTRMAVHTSFGFIVLGVGGVVYAWNAEVEGQKIIPKWFPILVGLASITTTILVWQAEDNDQKVNIVKQIQLTANHSKQKLQGELKEKIKGLNRMAKRWDVRDLPSKEEFVSDADVYRADHDSIHLIAFIDTEIHAQWLSPLEGNEKYLGVELPQVNAHSEALIQARETKQPLAFSGVMQDGKQAVMAMTPVFRNKKFLGFVAGVIEIEKLFERTLEGPYVQGIAGLLFEKIDIYREKKVSGWKDSRWLVKENFEVSGKTWELWLKPNQQWIDAQSSSTPLAILIVGSLISLFMTMFVHLMIRARYYARETETMNIALQKASEDLEIRIEERTRDLMKSESQIRSVIENSMDGMVVIDSDGIILSFNPACEAFFEYELGEIIGENITLLIPSHYREQHLEGLARFLKTRKPKIIGSVVEVEGLRKNGTTFPLELGIAALDGEDSQKFVGVIRDISERKWAEEELHKINKQSDTALDLTKSGYWHTPLKDDPGYYTSSDKAVAIFGDPPREGHRYHIMDEWFVNVKAGDKEAAEVAMENFQGALEGRYPLYDSTFAYKRPVDGKTVWIHALAHISRDENGKATDMYGVTQDITESKLLESDLREAREKAEEATKAKSDFLANMSHEIRTPMNAIIGMSHLALKTDLTPKQDNYLKKIESSSKSLLGIINDILDFSKIEAGKLDMEDIEFRLDEVLDNLSNLVTLKAQEKGLEVLFSVDREVPYTLLGDPLRLGQVLINLSNNAVKFTSHGEIIIAIKLMSEDPSGQVRLQFSVKDTGIGLTPDQAGKLFKSFSQVDASTTRKYGGTGLGLTISKHLVGMMNGKIWVESVPGKGSDFIFTATFGRGAEGKVDQLILSEDLQGMRVLIVDDNEAARMVLENALASFDLKVSVATSGAEGISKVEAADKKDPYDLVIMDWQMPEMNGIRTTEIIRKHPDLKKIPKIIMLTAYGREEVLRQAEQIGLDAFLVKPMNPSILLETIMEVFGKKTDRRQAMIRGNQEDSFATIQGARILLVEDNEINQEVANELLSQAGLVVTIANNGQEGVDMVSESEFDCVLMDCQMPVLDGYEATRTIRKDERFSSLPILAMTANAMKGDREKCMDAGMNDHISKPIDPRELFMALTKWIPAQDGSEAVTSPMNNPSTPKESALPKLPGIDVEAGLVRVNGNVDLYRKILSSFYQNNTGTKLEIENALEAGDLELAGRLVHTVKGVAATIGADRLAKVSQPLETELREGNENIDDNLWLDFWANLESTLSTVGQLEPKEVEDSGGKLDLTKVKLPQPLIDSMKEDVENGMLLDLEEHFSQMEATGPDGQKLAVELKDLARQFDDEEILKILETIEKN